MHGIYRAGYCLIGSQPVHTFHKNVAEDDSVNTSEQEKRRKLKTRIALQSA